MAIDQASAEEIVAALTKATSLCNESLRMVKANESLGQVKVYGRLVGDFLGHSYTNILAPIWKAYPDIEPSEMKEEYVEPVPTLTPESRAALSTFVTEARTSLEVLRRLLPDDKANQFSKFGGLAEVEHAVSAIEDFLDKPRFRDEGASQ